MNNHAKTPLQAIDFFCGAGGMTNGFRKAGIHVIAGIDHDVTCKETYEKNNVGAEFIHADIKELRFRDLEKLAGITKGDDKLIFIGCSPCQYFSKITTDKIKSAESKNLLIDFQRFISHFKPGFVVVENVPGIIRHEESPLKYFLKFLDRQGYLYDFDLIDAYKYGIPQTRRRFLLIASRVSFVQLPKPPSKKKVPTVRDFISVEKGFKPIPAGTSDKTRFMHTACKLSPKNLLRLEMTPRDGGTRMVYANDKALAIPTQYNNTSFSDTYGRMYWDRPAPTITTKFFSISNGRFAHPEQNRAISLREGATLQTFDRSYRFFSPVIDVVARHIGNAVPPLLSRYIARSIIKSLKS